MSDTHTRPLSITIKYGADKDDTWMVFQGTTPEVRAGIIGYFEIDPEDEVGLSLNQLVVNATKMAHAAGRAAGTLGATNIQKPKTQAASKPAVAGESGTAPAAAKDPWAEAEQAAPAKPAEPEKPKRNPIYDDIDGATNVKPELAKVWAQHQSAINADPELLAYFKAHGAKLKAAAA